MYNDRSSTRLGLLPTVLERQQPAAPADCRPGPHHAAARVAVWAGPESDAAVVGELASGEAVDASLDIPDHESSSVQGLGDRLTI